MSLSFFVLSKRSIHLLFYWILFENVMSLHRTKATLIGLFEAGRANEWVVTAKLGSGQSAKGNTKGLKKFPRIFKLPDRYVYFYTEHNVLLQNYVYKQLVMIMSYFVSDWIHWSLDLRRSCSCVDAMTMRMGRTITSSTCFFRPCHSSSVGLAGLGHMSRVSSHVFYISGEKERDVTNFLQK